ncbi:MAG: hypothetical protein KDA24_16125 [Deltaproteobacteria bacterium]|nr:hypothetical protein [Deltaproteobacteria bacterium]
MKHLLSLVAVACLGALFLTPLTAQAADKDFAQTMGQAWTWMEAGALDRADGAFKEVVADPKGRLLAEAYFGLAAVWWQKRNAMASYQRLLEAHDMRSTMGWDAGDGNTWDQRIDSRMKYIERNFTVVKLRATSKASVAPLSDPRPSDPLLREFATRVEANVDEGLSEGSLVQWTMLPNGTYWVGAELKTLEGGEMDPSRAREWTLDRGSRAKATYKERFALVEEGKSPAKDFVATEAPDPSSASTETVVEVMHRSIGVAVQGAFVPTRSLNGIDPDVAPDFSVGVQLEGRLALPPPILALAVSGGWKVLPVNGCRAAPTRAHLISLGVGPSVQMPLSESASLGVDVAFRGGLGMGGRSDAARLACVDKVGDLGAGAVVRGARATSDDVTSTFSLADVGWRGRAGALGGEFAVGPIIDSGGVLAFSVQLHVGYDHLIPILPSETADTLYLRDPRTGSVTAIEKGQAVSAAAMGRMQAGVRARVLF